MRVAPPAPSVNPEPDATHKGSAGTHPWAGSNQPVDWLFAYKFNAASFPGCAEDGVPPKVGSPGIFGGTVQEYPRGHSQRYVFAASARPTLAKGTGCLGATRHDPLGATFAQVYDNPGYNYVLWNDQFYSHPLPILDAPWGHSKGLLAWNDDGAGFVLQVSTPSWPASGSRAHPRQGDGNTLGCIQDDDVEVSQHFFALKLSRPDVAAVLQALANASVVTKTSEPSLVHNGGPAEIQSLVRALGCESASTACTMQTLSSGVQLFSKPSRLAVPPWQLVSARLGRLPLRVASWWVNPNAIYSTPAGHLPQCWAPGLDTPGAVEIATTGTWGGTTIGLVGGPGKKFNHAKIGISTDAAQPISIFGDMNQQGALEPGPDPKVNLCTVHQNGRGGTFYVVRQPALHASLTELLRGGRAPQQAPS